MAGRSQSGLLSFTCNWYGAKLQHGALCGCGKSGMNVLRIYTSPLLFGICIIKMFGLGWFRLTLNSLLSSDAGETQRGVTALLSSSASGIKVLS